MFIEPENRWRSVWKKIGLINFIKMFEFTCKKATQLSDKKQYDEINWMQIIRLKIHVSRCAKCRDYNRKNNQLTAIMEIAHLKILGDDEKTGLKTRLWKEMKKS